MRSGDLSFHNGGSGSSTGGGALTASAVTQSSVLQGADGAFTYEALVFSTVDLVAGANGLADGRTILSHDNAGTARGFSWRIQSSRLDFYAGGPNPISSLIPETGDHAFTVNKWFHVAVTYSGNAAEADNVKFYWTALDSGATVANLLSSATMTSDVVDNTSFFGVGTITRSAYRFEWQGLIDEVRISSVARGADEFVFVPEPASLSLLAIGGVLLLGRRRR